jgi:hypothetical protein
LLTLGIGCDLLVLLDPFLELTNRLSASSYVTCSMIIPGLQRLINILHLYESENHNLFMHDLAITMANDLTDRTKKYFNYFYLIVASTFMDPRYKKFKFIKDQYDRDILHFKEKIVKIIIILKYLKNILGYATIYRRLP